MVYVILNFGYTSGYTAASTADCSTSSTRVDTNFPRHTIIISRGAYFVKCAVEVILKFYIAVSEELTVLTSTSGRPIVVRKVIVVDSNFCIYVYIYRLN